MNSRQRQSKIRSQSEYVLSDVNADEEIEKHRQLHQYASSQLQCRGGGASDLSIIDTPMLSDTSEAWPGQRRSLPHNLRKAPPSLHDMLMSSTYHSNTHSPYERADDDKAEYCHPNISTARSSHSLRVGQGQGHIRSVNSIVWGRDRDREIMTSQINNVINTSSSDDILTVPVADADATKTTFATFRVVNNNRPSHSQTTSTSNGAPRSGGRKRKMILTFLPAANNEQMQQQQRHQQEQDNTAHEYKLLDPGNLERDHDHCHGTGGLYRPDASERTRRVYRQMLDTPRTRTRTGKLTNHNAALLF